MANLIRSQALYYEDPYCIEFKATIKDVAPNPDGSYAITLDQTYFYPTGGGQDHDTGTIGESQVIDVLRDDKTGMVQHIVKDYLPAGTTSCKIDWEHRLRNMQHHSGQHLLTQCVLRLFGFTTVSANINGYTPSTLDIVADRLLKDSELEVAEELANQIIYENRSINTYFVASEDIEKIPLRRLPKVSENIRIVEINDFDYSACGGTHCSKTGAIGIAKILKNERINNKTRIHFIAGHQALQQFRQYHYTITSLATQLSTNTQNLTTSVMRLNETIKQNQKEIQTLRRESLTNEAHFMISRSDWAGNKRFIFSSFESRPTNDLRMLADILKSQSDLVAVLTSYDGERLSIIVTSGKDTQVSATEILRRILIHIDGRGGGDNQIAQGGGAVVIENLDRVLNAGIQSAREII